MAMKLLLLAIAFMIYAGAARCDCFGIYSNPQLSGCFLTLLEPPAYNFVYVIQKFNLGSAASQFKVIDNSGLFPASQQTPYLALGTWNTDLSLAYGDCIFGDHVLLTLGFIWFGDPIVGCENWLSVGAAPTSPISGSIAVVDCGPPWTYRTGGSGWPFHFGADAQSCEFDCGCEHHETPVAASTWGAVKAMYR
jgi:hypothetical protein